MRKSVLAGVNVMKGNVELRNTDVIGKEWEVKKALIYLPLSVASFT
jgi:hypothetical protein